MNKQEILHKARQGQDEMVVQTRDKAMKVTYLVLVFTAAFFAFLRGLKDQPVMDLAATVGYSVFAGRLYCYLKTKEKYDLWMAVITIIVAVVATIRFFMGH